MPYAIITTDKPNVLELRLKVRPEHITYLDANKHRLLAAGAFLNDDGSGGHGGLMLVDTESRADAEDLINNDPFTKHGLFASIRIERWRKAYFNFERLV